MGSADPTLCSFSSTNCAKDRCDVRFPKQPPGRVVLLCDIRRIESIKDGMEVVGSRTRVKVVKNKVAPPFRQAEFDIMYGKGISREGAVLDMAVEMGIAKKSGAWFTYEGEQLGQGRENAKTFLLENPEIMVQMADRVRQAAGIGVPIIPEFSEQDDQPIELD